MGVSTDAIAFYGYCWHDETELPGGGDWDQVVALKRGHRNPWDDYPPEIEGIRDYAEKRRAEKAWADSHREVLDQWYAVQRDIREEFGVEVGGHCSGSCSMPYLAVSSVTANRGHPVDLSASLPAAGFPNGDPGWDAKLDRFMSELGIDKPEGQDRPRWWLVSYWG